MENKSALLEPLLERLEAYGKTSYELYKLKTIEKTSNIASNASVQLVTLIFVGLTLIMVNFGLALWLGELLGKVYYGSFCLAAFYSVVALLIHFLLSKWIKKKVGDSLVKQMLN